MKYGELRELVNRTFTNVKYGKEDVEHPLKVTGMYKDTMICISCDLTNPTKRFKIAFGSQIPLFFNNVTEVMKVVRNIDSFVLSDARKTDLYERAITYIMEHDVDHIYNRGNVKTLERCFDIITMWWKPYPTECIDTVLVGMFHMSDYEINNYCESLLQ